MFSNIDKKEQTLNSSKEILIIFKTYKQFDLIAKRVITFFCKFLQNIPKKKNVNI